jgi:uncharacterized protein YgbK (DUF1537 family)
LLPHAVLRPGAMAFTSDSRHLAPLLAAQFVQHLLSQLEPLHGQRWYKKIDSTLRGNLGAELDATLAALGRTHALICPAFPAQRRGLRHGRLVCDTTIATPIDLPTRLAEQSQRPIALVTLDRVRGTPAELANDLRGCAQHASLIVCDGIADADLDAITVASRLALPDALLCGSAGLFGALAAQHSPAVAEPIVDLSGRRVLIVIGSGSAMAHRQLQELQDRYHTAIVGADDALSAAITLLHLPPPPANAILDGPQARAMAEQLAITASQAIRTMQPDLLMIIGGDTAMALLTQLAITELHIQHELLPGISLSSALAHSGEQYQVILKAGSFGDSTTLADLLDRSADLQSARKPQ